MAFQEILGSMTQTDPIYKQLAETMGIPLGILVFIIFIVFVWSMIWKGFALWKSANKRQLPWFIVILLVNTIGILEILYIYVFSEMKFEGKKQENIRVVKKKK